MATEESKKSKPKEKRPIEFNLSDGVDWRDFVGLFILLFIFIWEVIKIILFPFFWVYRENVRMFRFIRAKGDERIMTEDERYFVETVPLIFTLSGLMGGVFLGVLAAVSFGEALSDFIEELDTGFASSFLNLIGSIIGIIFRAIVFVLTGIASGFVYVFDFLQGLFVKNAILAFIGLASVGLIVLLIYIFLNEKGVFDKLFGWLKRGILWIIGSPGRFRFRINNYYRRFNHWLTARLVGEKTLLTRTQVYFKRITLYTFVLSLYSFGAGLYVALNKIGLEEDQVDEFAEQVIFTAIVLFVAGFVSGTIFFAFVSRFLDLLSREKYIAKEYLRSDGKADDDKINELNQADKERRKAEAKAKPWETDESTKPQKASKKKPVKKATPKADDES